MTTLVQERIFGIKIGETIIKNQMMVLQGFLGQVHVWDKSASTQIQYMQPRSEDGIMRPIEGKVFWLKDQERTYTFNLMGVRSIKVTRLPE